MTISVVIPAHNEEKYIGKCLESLQQMDLAGVKEIVVVDNASTDRTAEIASKFPKVKVVYEAQKGLTCARQKGLETATGEILAYIDSDSRVPKQWLQIIQKHYQADPNLVCLSGPANYYDLSGLRLLFARATWILIALPISFILGYTVWGGNFAAKRTALQAIGGFDKNIEFYGEDMDIAVRLHRIGKVKFVNEFFVWTSGRRIVEEGILRTGVTYGLNYLWEVVFHRPFTKTHKDLR